MNSSVAAIFATALIVVGVIIGLIIRASIRRSRIPAPIGQARKLFQAGGHDQALGILDGFLKEDKSSLQAYQLRYEIYLANQRFKEAEDDIRAAVQLAPSGENCGALGRLLLQQGKYQEASDTLARSVKLGNMLSNLELGTGLFRISKYTEAIQPLETITKYLQDSFVTHKLLANYYLGRSLEALGDSSGAERAYKAMVRFGSALDVLERGLSELPDIAETAHKRNDLAEIKKRL